MIAINVAIHITFIVLTSGTVYSNGGNPDNVELWGYRSRDSIKQLKSFLIKHCIATYQYMFHTGPIAIMQ